MDAAKMRFKNWVICVIVLLTTGYAKAQPYKAVSISLAEGLSQSSVYDIIQDQKGFTWIATQDGLNKYDGIEFQTFREEPFDTNSISSNNTSQLLFDTKGRLWAGTANHGLNLYLPNHDSFLHFFASSEMGTIASNMVTSLYEDADGTIWVGTSSGLQRIKETINDEISHFTFEKIVLKTDAEDTLTDKFIHVITSDANKQLWVGTYAGLFKIDLTKDVIQNPVQVWFSKKNNRLINNSVNTLTVDESGNIWAGGRNGIDIISYPGENIRNVSTNNKLQRGMASDQVSALFTAANGDVWIGYNDQGIQVVRNMSPSRPITDTISFEHISTVTEVGALTKGNAISFCEDRITKGVIWAGFNAGGVVRLVPVTKNFVTNNLEASSLPSAFVTCILKQGDSDIWVGTPTGLLNYNRATSKYSFVAPSKFTDKPNSENYINGLALTGSNELFCGAGNYLYKISKSNNKINVEPIRLPDDIEGNNLRTFYSDSKGRLFVVMLFSIYEYQPEQQVFLPVMKIRDQDKLKDRAFYLSCYYIDQSGNHWIGTSNGLEYFPKATAASPTDFTSPVTYFHQQNDTSSLRNQSILSIAEDKNHTIWLGTMNGLSRVVVEKGKKKFINYSTRTGLKNNVIYAIVTDQKTGHLWLSTNNGLTEFNPSGAVVANYDIHDGLQSNEFNSYASFKAPDGELFFGGINGYTSFYPDQIKLDATPPKISITGIILNGNRLLNLEEFQQSKTIDLKYKDNSFTVNFIGLHYVDPQKNQYAYKLEGFQSDWIYSGSSRQVNFSQLPPGNYVFRVKAANSDGIYNTDGDMFVINIKPPFYKTIWFYLLIAAFIAGVLWGLHKYRLSMKLEQVKEVEKIRRATAADFHDELGHKLTIISWFAEILKKKIGTDQVELRPHLDKIIETSGTLYHTMKDMLWAMDPDKDSVYDLYSQIREFGQELFDNTGVLFDAQTIADDLKDKIISPADKRHVLLIFKEVMHNSLKHAGSTNTNLELVQDEHLIKFRFKDNGTGFKMNGHNVGHGLNNVKRRAQMIHARIDIHSEGTGTVAELDLPLENLN